MSDIEKAIEEVRKANNIAKYPVRVICHPNGTTGVFKRGQQVAEAQEAWLLGVAKNLENAGIDPLEAEITMPDGRTAHFFRIDDDAGLSFLLNWTIE